MEKTTIIFGEKHKLNDIIDMINMIKKNHFVVIIVNYYNWRKQNLKKNHIVLMIAEIIKMANNANIIMVNVYSRDNIDLQ